MSVWLMAVTQRDIITTTRVRVRRYSHHESTSTGRADVWPTPQPEIYLEEGCYFLSSLSSLSLPQRKRTFAATRHVPWALNTPKIAFAVVPRLQTHFSSPRNVSDGCKYRPLSVKRNLNIEAILWLFLNVLCVRILHDHFFTVHFISGRGILTP